MPHKGQKSRSSGFDFADRANALDAHPDMTIDAAAVNKRNLQRNRTERKRIQPLMRADNAFPGAVAAMPSAPKLRSLRDRFVHWQVNEGSRRMTFYFWIFLQCLVFSLGFMTYALKDLYNNARHTFGITFSIAKSSALVLHLDVAFILLPVCRNFLSILRRTPLNDIIPFDKNITFHKATAWSMVWWTFVHVAAHMVNFTRLGLAMSHEPKKVVLAFLGANFATGPGATGWIMTVSLWFIVWYAMEKRRRRPNGGFEKFWYSHHLFIVFFICWQLHGMFCMIPPDRAPFCSWNTVGVFWRYWLVGGLIFVTERVLREVRSRHRTYISKVVQHPSNVVEIQIKKEKTVTRAGQYIFLCCPEVSYWQWHPFTLTSAPEEDYISIHVRVVGDFTSALAKALGCDIKDPKDKGEKGARNPLQKEESRVVGTNTNPPLNTVLPRVMVDGPFGSASEDFAKFETVLLVGAGIGVTPFASILKTIWYRMNHVNKSKPTRLSKVYFVWVIRDFGTAEWFHSLLHAIEEQDTQGRIEINIYLTAKIKEEELNHIVVQDVGAERDAITSLRAPTHFGRPNWDRVFSSIVDKHPETDVGVFYCGPSALSRQLHQMSNKYTSPKGTRFFFGKENF